MARLQELFVTQIYREEPSAARHRRCYRSLARRRTKSPPKTGQGRRGRKRNDYAGYTSYASLNDLPGRHPAFADLVAVLGSACERLRENARIRADGEAPGARQPMDQCPETGRLSHRAYPPAFGDQRHAVPCRSEGRQRDQVRRSAIGDDEGRTVAQAIRQKRRTRRSSPSPRPRARCCCGKAGSGTRCPSITQRPKRVSVSFNYRLD